MATPLCNYTVIRGNGPDVEVVIRGVVMKEIQRMKEEHEQEVQSLRAEMDITKARENQLLADKLRTLTNAYSPKRGIKRFKRACVDKIQIAWGYTYYFFVLRRRLKHDASDKS